MNLSVIRAVFNRNFVSYFSNPTGYVFICVFVVLGSVAAFWPAEFFNANLANLDQLNKAYPLIMLVFIPAITMSLWADERRQGTDELLLTLPASDTDVVLGKYLAAAAIFTVALLFSGICNLAVLYTLGSPDVGLFYANYVGYWMVGLAMLSIGMVASFLTSNLTVGFILGALFNAPLVFLEYSELLFNNQTVALNAKQWSVSSQLVDFGQGVVSFASFTYFFGIIVLMLYICVVLIGRRHWASGQEGRTKGGHYLARSLSIMAIVAGIVLLSRTYDARADLSSERISTVSADTRALISKLDNKRPVRIDAYVSPSVPEQYVQVRQNLLSTLRSLEKLGGGNIEVNLHSDVEPLSDTALNAADRYGIRPQKVQTRARGALKEEEIFLGAAFTCGLQRVVVPFFGSNAPVEYELVRSICTVSEPKRKRLGVLNTESNLFGGFDMQSMSQRPRQAIIEELEKQYDVIQVDAANSITERFDVLLAVQPSSLGPQQLSNFVAAVKAGQPTAIFEDPLPLPGLSDGVPGTGQPKRPRQSPMSMFQQQQQVEPKGNILELFNLLGIDMVGKPAAATQPGEAPLFDAEVIWQNFNPYPKAEQFAALTPEFVFISPNAPGAKEAFNPNQPIVAGLQQVLLPYPGAINKLNTGNTKFTPLCTTGTQTGTINVADVMQLLNQPQLLQTKERSTGERYVVAALIQGPATGSAAGNKPLEGGGLALQTNEAKPAEAPAAKTAPAEKAAAPAPAPTAAPAVPAAVPAAAPVAQASPKPQGINVVFVADIDMLQSVFFSLRAQSDEEIGWDFDNVTFVLNSLDMLAGDTRFFDIRNRKPVHRRLETIDARMQDSRKAGLEEKQKFVEQFVKDETEAKMKSDAALQKLQQKIESMQGKEDTDQRALQETVTLFALQQQNAQKQREQSIEKMQRERDKNLATIDLKLTNELRSLQDGYKMWALLLPPIPPLVVAFLVYFDRRAREKEGVSKARLR